MAILVTLAMPKKPALASSLIITHTTDEALTAAQIEFNRLMMRLEKARAKHLREQKELDELLVITSRVLMPLIEDLHRTDRDIVFQVSAALNEIKFNEKRRRWLKDLVSGKASDLVADPVGLSVEDLARLEAIVAELAPPYPKKKTQEATDEFASLRNMMETIAREVGLDLNFSDLDLSLDPAEIEREMEKRLRVAVGGPGSSAPKLPRKQTKAQLEKARKLQEQEEAKKRDFKSLYKQLAKVLHPDLETDPQLKQHKEIWMKRLTSAYAAGDLRELLHIEMEWLGEESTNLATASEEKLRVYCAVLKQQIADLKRQTEWLLHEPQYGPLDRFIDPNFGYLANFDEVRRELLDENKRSREVSKFLVEGGLNCRQMMEEWADQHGQSLRKPKFSF
jgi:hypothetical protein